MAIPLGNVLFNDGLAVDVNRLAHPLFMRYVKTSCNIDRFLNIIAWPFGHRYSDAIIFLRSQKPLTKLKLRKRSVALNVTGVMFRRVERTWT